MRFTYCPHCGEKLTKKEIGDEGLIPFCVKCQIPLWEMFTTSIICGVINEYNEIALLRQKYVSETKYVCVAGIMKIGESGEEAAVREIKEEIGLDVKKLQYIKSYPYDKKEMLMLGYRADVKKAEMRLSGEVDDAGWFPLSEAPGYLREGGIAWQLVKQIIEDSALTEILGQIVNVTVDRPLGSCHPKHKDIVYPVNYGYIKGVMAPDGEEQDVYILGIDKPVKEFTGKIIAVVHRFDDVEEKWVAAPENMTFSREDIREQILFQEKYFDFEIRM